MKSIVFASGNAGKIAEVNSILGELNVVVKPQSEFGVPEAAETGTTFVENAIIKARNAAEHTNLPALADDSGIEIDALNGAPGVYSARYAGPDATDDMNNQTLLDALEGIPAEKRTARYRCVMVYMQHAKDATPIICLGTWEGRIATSRQGDGGFGYDPLFIVNDTGLTAASMSASDKHKISHRGIALRALHQALTRA